MIRFLTCVKTSGTFLIFMLLSSRYIYFLSDIIFIISRFQNLKLTLCVVFGRMIEDFLISEFFTLTACHCLSAHGNKSFFYLPFLSFTTFASYPPLLFPSCFSSNSLFICFFLPFYCRHQSSFRLFGRVVLFFFFLKSCT